MPPTIVPFLEMLGLGSVLAVVAVVVLRRMRNARGVAFRSAETALAASRRLAPADRLAAQARLLRRVARTVSGDKEARAEGAAWLAALDRIFATRFFTDGEGRVFAGGLYRSGSERDVDAIDGALHSLLRSVRF